MSSFAPRFSASALSSRLGACLLVILAACSDQSTAPEADQATLPVMAVLSCTGSAASVSCEPIGSPAATSRLASGLSLDVVLGGQNTYVQLRQVSSSFNSGTNQLSAVVAVRNLTTQALGTFDGTTLDPNAVRIYFHSGPTNGVTIVNPDGVGSFTASNQPFFKYNEIIGAGATNATPKTWIFQLPSAVTTFTFQVYVVGRMPDESVPVTVPARAFTQLSLGSQGGSMCAIRTGGASYCWGKGVAGQLGNGTTVNMKRPALVAQPVEFTVVGRGNDHACALTSAGAAYCWGDNISGQIGDSTNTRRTTPTAVKMPAGVTFSKLAVGGTHSCAMTAAGVPYCWGSSSQVGHGSFVGSVPAPRAVLMPAGVGSFVAITAGGTHSCGLSSSNVAYCWGTNANGQLGDNSTTNRNRPVAVTMPSGVTFSAIVAGGAHTCALGSNSSTYCWGYNGQGQLGNGTAIPGPTSLPTRATPPAGVVFNRLAMGGQHSCALSTADNAYCWGYGTSGGIGNGGMDDVFLPTAVVMPSGVKFKQIAGSGYTNCAISATGIAYCWGENFYGQSGNDSPFATQSTPVAVTMP